MAERFGSLEDYKSGLERYRRERAEALAAGFPEDHPIVKLPTRRAATAEKIIERLEARESDKVQSSVGGQPVAWARDGRNALWWLNAKTGLWHADAFSKVKAPELVLREEQLDRKYGPLTIVKGNLPPQSWEGEGLRG